MARPTAEIISKRNELFPKGLYLCGKCSEVKPLLEFYANKNFKHGVRTTCKPCVKQDNKKWTDKQRTELGDEAFLSRRNEIVKKWRKNTRPKRLEHFQRYERENNYKKNYGITIADFNRLLAEQDGRCGICETPKPQKAWHVDHCHNSDEVRGILCNLCNVAIGAFKENVEALHMAEIYLRPRGKIGLG